MQQGPHLLSTSSSVSHPLGLLCTDGVDLMLFSVPAVYDLEVAFPKDEEPDLRRMLMGEGSEVHLRLR